jgi:hypothetical protein
LHDPREAHLVAFEVFWKRFKGECATWSKVDETYHASRFRKWTAEQGDLNSEFIALWSGGDTFVCNTEETKSPRTMSRAEFEKVYNVWMDYRDGAKGRSYIDNKLGVQNSTWIIALLYRHRHLMQ